MTIFAARLPELVISTTLTLSPRLSSIRLPLGSAASWSWTKKYIWLCCGYRGGAMGAADISTRSTGLCATGICPLRIEWDSVGSPSKWFTSEYRSIRSCFSPRDCTNSGGRQLSFTRRLRPAQRVLLVDARKARFAASTVSKS